ncbi:MAG: glutamate-5-semialdehyde dehydrogenase [Candidatus Omnitrophica bacterium]|nr:glutamate-5-semialdehyde dehydrogenase [Candidatus Omnitrophota bacterium]MDD5352725.1 glutamate-5-semialdehyde dehydrogenase [Candidatus Omnitrophota bacterium]MDD5550324.1 glutamate-5-semialdehyde dehydrogenase [Candidatus Omnitrophota bacterium]
MEEKQLKLKLKKIANLAKDASFKLNLVDTATKNTVLKEMAEALIREKEKIISANKKDLQAARKNKISEAFIERLTLSDERIQEMSDSLVEVSKLDDPVASIIKSWQRPNGLKISKVRVPIGVILIIYESRPNVTADCIGLCLKSSNCVILRGGSDALNSNKAIFSILNSVALKNGIPQGSINFIDSSERKAVDVLLQLDDLIDVVIPRGGEGLIREVKNKSRIPVIKHYKGICHVYVDSEADLNMAGKIAFNAKVERPGVCNAMETLLVHKDVAIRFLPGMIKELQNAGCEIRGCAVTRKIARNFKNIKSATEKDWSTEYLDLILSVKVVDSLSDAIKHINYYGSHHSDSIITDNRENAERFLKEVDSACVFVNASTRFTDGYQFGMGAEMGISTDKLHARGPMALEELTTYKYIIEGNGQIRE